MISVDEAITRICKDIKPLSSELISLSQSLGRVLSRDIIARVTHPPMAVSAMDGYAVRSADLIESSTPLKCIGMASAGSLFPDRVQSGETVRILTGAVVPEGANAVIPQEYVDVEEEYIMPHNSAPIESFIRPAGMDFNTGDIGLRAGQTINARQMAMAGAMNVPWLHVYRRPCFALLSTGDEIVMPGDPIAPGQIINSSSIGLMAFIESMGGIVTHLGIVGDTDQDIAQQVDMAKRADVLIITGGVGDSERDRVRDALISQGMRLEFWKIAMRPGKLVLCGSLNTMLVLGFPGNPVSTMVCALIFLMPLWQRWNGISPINQRADYVRLGQSLPANDHRQAYLRASLTYNTSGQQIIIPFAHQDSAMLSTLAQADCLLIRPAYAQPIEAGNFVPIVHFPTFLGF